MSDHEPIPAQRPLRPLPSLIFASRWLQLPLYLGLIVAQGVYVVHFLVELWHLVEAAFGHQGALQALVTSACSAPWWPKAASTRCHSSTRKCTT